jgi:putative FmdB family regulatory protein
MPIYEYECAKCTGVFEVIVDRCENGTPCPSCRSRDTKKLIAAPSIHVRGGNATPRIEKRVKDYLKDGKFSEATRFADKAASMTKSENVKRIAEKLHNKTGK